METKDYAINYEFKLIARVMCGDIRNQAEKLHEISVVSLLVRPHLDVINLYQALFHVKNMNHHLATHDDDN